MVQLSRSMMERYEIADRRPEKIRALITGADPLMLGGAARLLDEAGVGAVCCTGKAEHLAAQDGMFTLLIRGEGLDGKRIREEKVVQSIAAVCPPSLEALLPYAEGIEVIFCHAGAAAELALAAALMHARMEKGLAAPALIELSSDGAPAGIGQAALMETLCGTLSEGDLALARREMNYQDDFIAWAEPYLRLTIDGEVPECIAGACSGLDYAAVCHRKERIFDAILSFCACAGYLAGKNNYAGVLKDETLRAWIGRSFQDELLPALPYSREEIAPDIISAFERLENPMNDMPLLDIGRNLFGRFSRSILPAIRAYAQENFEAPRHIALALAAAIMLYAGARPEADGSYWVARGDEKHRISDDPEILEAFSRFSHDMPAETLAYAALADRDIWGCDLREIDGLEMRVAYDLASIQRTGFMETLRGKAAMA